MIPRWLLKIKLIAIATIVIVIALNHNVLKAEQGFDVQEFRSSDVGAVREPPLQKFRSWQDYANSISLTEKSIDNSLLPIAKAHPLPTSLAEWEDKNNQKDYFTQIKPTPLGYLIWSQFPIKIYVAKPTLSLDNSASSIRQQQWIETVRKAIAEWSIYLSLQETDNPELADITIARSTPERKVKLNPATGLYDIPRAITAQTTYQFYWQDSKILSHRMTIKVSPSLSQPAILAATRHELGHALGIWGHSRDQNDALYFSQVRDFPPISARDINTLKKIYQQPTKLGWSVGVVRELPLPTTLIISTTRAIAGSWSLFPLQFLAHLTKNISL